MNEYKNLQEALQGSDDSGENTNEPHMIPINSVEELEDMMKEHLGSFEDAKVGQFIKIPVASDGEGNHVYFGPLDFSGTSNELNDEELKEFYKKESGFKPDYFTIVKKSSDIKKQWIFAKANCSIGPCDMIALYDNLVDLLNSLGRYGFIEEDDTQDLQSCETLEELIDFCNEHFNHSFFTGLVYGPVEYVSGPKPNADGFALV